MPSDNTTSHGHPYHTLLTSTTHAMSSWPFVDPATLVRNEPAALRAETLRRMELYVLHILHTLCTAKTQSGKRLDMRVLRSLRETLLVLQLLHENVCHNIISTQRDLYYHLVREACRATRVADIIQQIAQSLSLPRQALGVTAGMRGAVGGTVRFHGRRLTAAASNEEEGGIAMPVREEELRVRMATSLSNEREISIVTDASLTNSNNSVCEEAFVVERQTRFILVLEKHTVFYKLMQERLYDLVPCVMLTAQGFPTHAARVLLHNLHTACPHLPIVGLVDYNPSGLAILMQYRLGNAQVQESLGYAVPALRWLGLRKEHFMGTHRGEKSIKGNVVDEEEIPRLLPRQACTARDQAVMRHLLTKLINITQRNTDEDKEAEAAQPSSLDTSVPAASEAASNLSTQCTKKYYQTNPCPAVIQLDEADRASLSRWHDEATAMQRYNIKVEIEAMYSQAQWSSYHAHCNTCPYESNRSEGMRRGVASEPRFAEWVCRRLLKHDYI